VLPQLVWSARAMLPQFCQSGHSMSWTKQFQGKQQDTKNSYVVSRNIRGRFAPHFLEGGRRASAVFCRRGDTKAHKKSANALTYDFGVADPTALERPAPRNVLMRHQVTTILNDPVGACRCFAPPIICWRASVEAHSCRTNFVNLSYAGRRLIIWAVS